MQPCPSSGPIGLDMSTNIAPRGGAQMTGPAEELKGYGEDRRSWRDTLPTMTDSGEIDLRGFVRILYRRKGLLLLSMAVTMVATVIWISLVTPRYTSDALIVIEPRPLSMVKVDETVQDFTADAAKVNTEVAVLESRSLAARVIRDLELTTDPEFAPEALTGGLLPILPSLERALSMIPFFDASDEDSAAFSQDQETSADPRGEIQRPLVTLPALTTGTVEASDADLTIERTALLHEFLHHLTVEPEDKSRLIRVSFESTDPAKAARIANQIVGSYIENQLETKSRGARLTAEWLDIRLLELGDTVQLLEQEVRKRRAQSGSDAIGVVAKTLEQLNSELVSAQAAAAAVKARYEQAKGVLNGKGDLESLPSVIGSESIQTLRARYVGLRGRLSNLQTTLGERHPDIVAIRAELADLARRLDLEIETILAGLRNEVRGAEIREAGLRNELDSVSTKMVRLKEAEASIEQVAQQLQANQDLYGVLLQRYTEAVALRDNQQPDARIISAAEIPLKPSFPNLPRILGLAFIGSASLSILLLLMFERLRQKLETPEDVERHIGLPVIGAIPDLPRLWRMKATPSDYIQRKPLSEFGSTFQRLRALLILGNDRKMPRRVLVTSATAGEGKTTTAVCLAVTCVASGQRVLLVDCDFGRPRLHKMMDITNGTGLTDVVKGTAKLEDSISHVNGLSLSILTIGRSRDDAIALLNYGLMEDLLTRLEDGYDTVILDSASVLEISNALVLGGLVEKTILVTRRNWTSGRKASEAAKQLHLYGAQLAGLVFNRASAATP